MSLSDLAQRLERSFRTSERQLTRLLAELQEQRTSWIAARPEQVRPGTDLDAIAAELHGEDMARAAMAEELGTLLPLPPGVRIEDMHVNVTRVAKALSAGEAQRLQRASADATAIAKRVRRELALGRRLLHFAQRTNESLLADVTAVQQADEHKVYDRRAMAGQSGSLGVSAGSLVDGRM